MVALPSMIRACLLTLFVHTFLGSPSQAHHFTIDLEAKSAANAQKAGTDTLAPGIKNHLRPVLDVNAGQPVKVQWTLTNRDARESFKNVLVHFFVVKEDQAGQQRVPELKKGVAVESALTMDFRPGERARGELTFTLNTPGVYLLRLETIGAAVGVDGHEHFAALDLVAK
jgi:hypothetical protein